MGKEVFRFVKEFDDKYSVSSKGRVLSMYKGRFLKPYLNSERGYYYISLHSAKTNKKRRNYSLHRLVAETFIPNPKNLPQVNHKDKNPLNCAVENLEWVTMSENMYHSFRHGRKNPQGQDSANSKLTTEEVLEIRRLKSANPKLFNSQLATMFHVAESTIQGIIVRSRWRNI